jgi:PAS domain S-box-containing protein
VPEVLKNIVRSNYGDAMAIVNSLTIVEVNNACARMLGYENPSEMCGVASAAVTTPESQKLLEKRYARRLAGEVILDPAAFDFVKKNGEVFQAEINAVPWPEDASIFLAVLRDVTARERGVEELKESEMLYRTIAETIPAAVMLADHTGRNFYVNDQATELTGYAREELLEGVWLVHPDDKEAHGIYKGAFSEGTSGRAYETRFVRKDSGVIWVSISWEPIRSRGGKLQGTCQILIDITERKRAVENLLNAHAALEKAYDLQREFLNSVTHEVRTPLTAVQGYAEMLLEGMAGPLTTEQASLLEKVLESSGNLLEIVNSLLELARLKAGPAIPRPKACKPSEIVRKAVSTVLPQAAEKGLDISVHFVRKTDMGMYDGDKLTVILTNLLSNAVKFTQKGLIKLSVSPKESGFEVVVADTGMGISANDLVTLFDEFQQLADPRKHKPSGFGLGLAIVATMVDIIDASLTVSSAKGLGTAFTLYAPELEK